MSKQLLELSAASSLVYRPPCTIAHEMGRRLVIACVVAGVLAFAPAALATTETASLGDVTATFTFKGAAPNYRHERLRISRAGTVLYNQPVSSKYCQSKCAPGFENPGSAVHVVDLEQNGQPDVVLDLYSGGAHCCSIEQVFSFDPATMTYVETERDFGDPGVRLVDLFHNGQIEFLSADDSFAYEFTDYAASGLPIQILSFSARHFLNVTRSHPRAIARDAATWLSAFKRMRSQHYRDSVGVIAAWAADEDLLRHAKMVRRYLSRQAKAGHLKSALSPEEPGGKKFVTKLQRFLRNHRYLG